MRARRWLSESALPKTLRAGSVLALVLAVTARAWAVDTPPSSDLPDLSGVRAQIYAGEYEPAVRQLLDLSQTVRHADVYNLLGFGLRKLGRYDESARWYREALIYEPGHRAALQYQGELFIAQGDVAAAQKNWRYLDILCGQGPCPERDLLTRALADAGHGTRGG